MWNDRSTLLSQEFLKDYIYYCRYYGEMNQTLISYLWRHVLTFVLIIVSPEITEGAVTALIEVRYESTLLETS